MSIYKKRKHLVEMSDRKRRNRNVLRKEGSVLFNDARNTFLTVIWRQTYGKGPFR